MQRRVFGFIKIFGGCARESVRFRGDARAITKIKYGHLHIVQVLLTKYPHPQVFIKLYLIHNINEDLG